jgi:hypothetical protein
LRQHVKGEPVCFYLCEAVKPGAQQRFEGVGHGELYRKVSAAIPYITTAWYTIKRVVDRAKTTGSRMDRKPGWQKSE